MLHYLQSKPAVTLPGSLSSGVIHDLATCIEARKYEGNALELSARKVPEDTKVPVIMDNMNWESVSTAMVLAKCVRKVLTDPSMAPYCLEEGNRLPTSAEVSVFILSNGAFADPMFVANLMMCVGKRFVPIIAEDAFRFPTATMLEEIRAGLATKLKPYGVQESPDEIVNAINNVFKEIAIVFSPQDYSSNEALLEVKAVAIGQRLNSTSLQKLAKTGAETSEDTKPTQVGGDSLSLTVQVFREFCKLEKGQICLRGSSSS